MVESVDTQDLKSCGSNTVRVQVPPWVLYRKLTFNLGWLFLLLEYFWLRCFGTEVFAIVGLMTNNFLLIKEVALVGRNHKELCYRPTSAKNNLSKLIINDKFVKLLYILIWKIKAQSTKHKAQSTKHKAQSTKLLLALFLISNFLIQSCKKDKNHGLDNLTNVKPNVEILQTIPIENGVIVNPFSLKNYRSTYSNYSDYDLPPINENNYHLMIKFSPDQVNENTMQYIEDTTISIYDVPLNASELYQSGASEEDLENLKDGYLYTTLPYDHQLLQHITYDVLDSLILPKQDQLELEQMLLLNAGYFILNENDSAIENPVAKIKIKWPKTKTPEGYVTYTDEQLGTQNSRGVEVWAIKFGFIVSSHTDNNGRYKIPHHFLVGTTIGLHYRNNRVNIKPINTTGSWWNYTGTLISEFAVGSKFIQGWVGLNDLDNKNIFIGSHRELRTWAHIMNSVFHHDNYCTNDGITKSPTSLVIYAHWANNPGGASTPMLGHMSVIKAYADPILTKMMGQNNSLLSNYPNVFNALFGLLPDITIRTASSKSFYTDFSCETTQTMFHELAHASHFNKVGTAFWVNVINQELSSEGCAGYGCGNWQNSSNGQDKYIQVTEAWAEFLGQRYALNMYGNNARIVSAEMGLQTLGTLRDGEHWFANNWICKGIFNDLIDNFSSLEPLDNINGRTVAQLYNLLGSSVINIEDYQTAYVNTFGNNANFQDIRDINMP